MLTVASLLWQANDKSLRTSRCYDETWAEKLYRGFARNLTVPFRFVLYTDRRRIYGEPIEQIVSLPENPGYCDCIRPYDLGGPMILVGLDTVVTGNIDHLAHYCLTADKIALPRDPYAKHRACNGVALIPAGWERIASEHRGQNDMEWLRTFPHAFIDDLWPGDVVSYKGEAKQSGIADTSIIYFHGEEKPHQLPARHPILDHWK